MIDMIKRCFLNITPGTAAVVTAIFVMGTIFSFCTVSQSLGDDITFLENSSSQKGQVLEEDNQSIVVRFPKSAIKAIKKDPKKTATNNTGKIIWEKTNDSLILKIPRQFFGTSTTDTGIIKGESIEATGVPEAHSYGKIEHLNHLEEKDVSMHSVVQQNKNLRGALLKEEMGRVEGVIRWKGRPLKNGKVNISLVRYTGFSFGSLKKEFSKENKGGKEISLITKTDTLGRYAFDKAPPGFYRIYWMPEGETGWIHRLRDKPDFEVFPGKLTVQNIPDKKK